MTSRVQTTALQQDTADAPHLAGLVQRSCACGGSTGMMDSCESCNAKELAGTPMVQPRLVVGPVNDPYEQEADRVAEQVMRTPDTEVAKTSEASPGPVIQRLCTECEEDEEKVQRQSEGEEEEEQSVQAKREGGPTGGEISAKQTAEIETIKSGGEPLNPSSRNFFEQRFGHDFSNVRIHSDERAAQSAKSIDAQAYTNGPHIVFGAGHYSPHTHAGQKLLAHELTHVIQQGKSMAQTRLMRAPDDPADKARYPTTSERKEVKGIFHPQQTQVEESGSATVEPVKEPDKFEPFEQSVLGTQILSPVVGGPVGEKAVKAGGLLGVSADF